MLNIHDNFAHDNTAGILILNLPERPMLAGDKAKVHHNRMENNNLPNFAEMGTIASLLPQGTGMILLWAAASSSTPANGTRALRRGRCGRVGQRGPAVERII